MANRAYRRPWAAVVGLVGCLVVSLVASLVACGTTTSGSNGVGWTAVESTARSLPPGPSTPAGGVPTATVRVLQLNLCSSGIASCYTGRSTTEAAAVIRAEVPDLVTLNEICRDDLSILQQALSDVAPGAGVIAAFQAAGDRRTGEAYRCRNGQQYGIGLISRWPAAPGSSAGGGIYPVQDAEDPEERAWLCMRDISTAAATPTMTFCTTHLAYTKRDIAAAQCRYLFGTVIADLRERGASAGARCRPEPRIGRQSGRSDVRLGRFCVRRRRRPAARSGDARVRRQ